MILYIMVSALMLNSKGVNVHAHQEKSYARKSDRLGGGSTSVSMREWYEARPISFFCQDWTNTCPDD